MRKRKNSIVIILMAFLCFLLTSCGGKTNQNGDLNKLRIISLAPSNTEILVSLGLGDNIVGVDEYSNDVDGVSDNVEVFKIGDPSMESLIELHPNYVILSGHSSQLSKYNELDSAGIQVLNIETPTSIEDIYSSIEFLGNELSRENQSKEIVSTLRKKVEKISNENKNLEVKPRVYFEISQAPYLYSFGENTYLNEMIELCGGENIFSNQDGWIAPSEEGIIKSNPEIIFTNVDVDGNIDEIKNRAGWENIDAIKNNRVYYIDKDTSSRPSQFFIEALEDMNDHIREYNEKK